MPTQARLRELYDYDPLTGVLTFKQRRRGCKPGKAVGHLSATTGYLVAKLEGRQFGVHCLAWVWMNGPIPAGMVIDHRDGITLNNRFANLRCVTRSLNQRNARKNRKNTSGANGVRLATNRKHWIVEAKLSHQPVYIGSYATFEEAVAARAVFDAQNNFTPEHGKERGPGALAA